MATTYYLTTTASDLSVPGDNWDNSMTTTAPGATTLNQSVANEATENDYGYTAAGVPGADGTSGNYTVTVEVNTGNIELTLDCAVARVNSSGTVQGGPTTSDGGGQTASAGTKTYNFTSPSLGTWASGDRLRVTFTQVNANKHGGDEVCTHDIGSAGTRVSAPWTITPAGPSAGLRTLGLSGVGI